MHPTDPAPDPESPADSTGATERQLAGSPPGSGLSKVVGIGASAGGLAAIVSFFQAIPADTTLTFVLVQHLSPDFESHMKELLGRETTLPIKVVRQEMSVDPGTIYLIPPAKVMIISGGKLLLTDRPRDTTISLPIDVFFRSLGLEMKSNSVGIVLSGTGSDGSRGLMEIHAEGGLVLVQDPLTAEFDGMPNAAIGTEVVDAVLSPTALAEAVVGLGDKGFLIGLPLGPATPDGIRQSLDKIFEAIRARHGVDFSQYKAATVGRRMERRRVAVGASTLQEYTDVILGDVLELDALYADLLIGVTRFRRDGEAFDYLESQILAQLISDEPATRPLRVWCAGCSTGQEAYSVAIALSETMRRTGTSRGFRIFATDVDDEAVRVASAGVYGRDQLAEYSDDVIQRYFEPVDGELHARPEFRDSLVFARHDLLSQPPFTQVDLLVCRNLLIYFDSEAQRRSLSLFHFALRTGGVLFLGPSENVADLGEEFTELDGRWRVFRKRRGRMGPGVREAATRTGSIPLAARERPRPGTTTNQRVDLYEQLLERYVPPSILVDEHFEIIQMIGGVEALLRLRGGRISTSLLDLVEPELKSLLVKAAREARHRGGPVSYGDLGFAPSAGEKEVTITVQPLAHARHGARLESGPVLIQFGQAPVLAAAPANPTVIDVNPLGAELQGIRGLQDELAEARENLQTTVEELETANEELQASNEELVSSNEELQSTNEELHSVNEELFTVNGENERRIVEISQAKADMENLLAATEVGVVFLGEDLRIRSFTPKIAQDFGLTEADQGQGVGVLARQLVIEGLDAIVTRVLVNQSEFEREVRTVSGRPYLCRAVGYVSAHRIAGVVLTLVDVTTLMDARRQLARFKHMVDGSEDNYALVDPEGVLVYANVSFCEQVGMPREAVEGALLWQFDSTYSKERYAELFAEVQAGGGVTYESELRRRDGSTYPAEVGASPLIYKGERLLLMRSRDISQRRIRERHRELIREVHSFAIQGPVNESLVPQVLKTMVSSMGAARAEAWRIDPTASENPQLQGVFVDESLDDAARKEWLGAGDDPWILDLVSEAGEVASHTRSETPSQECADARDEHVCVFAVKLDGGHSMAFALRFDVTEDYSQALIDETCAAVGRTLRLIFERRRVESDLELKDRAMAASTDGIVIADGLTDGNPLCYVNSGFERITGYSSDDAVGQSWHFLEGPETSERGSEALHDALRNRESERISLLLYRKNRETFWCELQLTPVANEHGVVTHFIGVLHDITERIEAERNLLEARQRASAASAAKSRFLANVSHDIRSPLTAILGYSDAIKRSMQDGKALEHLGALRRNAEFLLSLMGDILDISKIEAGQLVASVERVDLPLLFRDIWEVTKLRTDQKGLRFDWVFESGIPRFGRLDPTRLRQILVNLIGNAVKFTERGGVTVRVAYGSKGPGSKGASLLRVAVEDTGIGMDASAVEAIFVPFARPHANRDTDSAAFEGTGLGLSIVQGLVDSMSGRISVQSQLREGSTFEVQLPLEDPSLDELASALPISQPADPEADRDGIESVLAGLSLLVADDRPDVLKVIQFYLEEAGAQVSTATHGEEALRLVDPSGSPQAALPFDLVILDMQMPIMDGYTAARELRRRGIDVPIIALTAGAMKEDREKCLAAGCSAFLLKPAEEEALLSLVIRLVEEHRSRETSNPD